MEAESRGRRPGPRIDLQAVDAQRIADQAAAATNRSSRRPRLLVKWAEIDPWQQDNHYILTAYRPFTNSWSDCFQSLFYLHNESVNVHSHLVGAFLFLFTAISIFFHEKDTLALPDAIVLSCFFISAVFCLGTSAMYHLVSNHSFEVARFGNQMDYVGIVALITGSFIPSIYYGFYCDPGLKKLYWSMITFFAIICTTVSLDFRFRTPKWRPFRALMFIAMGLSAVFPVVHGVRRYGIFQLQSSMGLSWVMLQGALYVIGAALYAVRCPERFYPGKYDIWGSSHQIFHLLIIVAAGAHLIGLMESYHYNRTYAVCSS